MCFVTPVVEHWLEREIAQWVHPMKDRSDEPSHHERRTYGCDLSQKVLSHDNVYCEIGPRPETANPLSYFSFQPVLHDWCNKGRGMCYPVCGMVHIKEPLLLIDKSSLCGGSGFPFSLSEWSLTICLTPNNRR